MREMTMTLTMEIMAATVMIMLAMPILMTAVFYSTFAT